MASMDFWCELASTYTYLTASRIDALAVRARVEVRWRPFSLGPVFAASGLQTSPFNVHAEKGRYMWRDVEREAERIGLPFRRPSTFPRSSVLASKVALLGVERGWGPRFIQRTMRAGFAEDRDIGAPEVLDEILAELRLDGPVVRDEATSAEHNGALRRSTEEASAWASSAPRRSWSARRCSGETIASRTRWSGRCAPGGRRRPPDSSGRVRDRARIDRLIIKRKHACSMVIRSTIDGTGRILTMVAACHRTTIPGPANPRRSWWRPWRAPSNANGPRVTRRSAHESSPGRVPP